MEKGYSFQGILVENRKKLSESHNYSESMNRLSQHPRHRGIKVEQKHGDSEGSVG